MNIHPIPVLTDNYVWIIEKDNKALLVDPGEATPVLQYLSSQKLELAAILLTHHHGDHTNGVAGLLAHFNVPVIASSASNVSWVTHRLEDGEYIQFASFAPIRGISIPGHTLDHMAYQIDNTLFTGDTLFAAGCGRVFEGTHEMMYASLQKLAALPKDLNIYCGHEYTETNLRFAEKVEPENIEIAERIKRVRAKRLKNEPSLPSSLAIELKTNPFLRCELSDFIKLRQLKDTFR